MFLRELTMPLGNAKGRYSDCCIESKVNFVGFEEIFLLRRSNEDYRRVSSFYLCFYSLLYEK